MNNEQIGRLLQDLVRIPSVGPHGDPGTDAKNTGEARMVEFLADFLRKLALDVQIQEVEPGRPNVIGKFSSRGGKHAVALAPHTDTVSVAGMTIDPFGAEMRDGKLFGRGATDAKGSMAAMLAALANVVREKTFCEGDLDVYFCGLMGEESGNDGARALATQGFRPDFLIAGEPTECRIVYTHKGSMWFKLITRGRSAHGATPERGENAISKMAEVVRYLLGDYADSLRRSGLPAATTLGPPTVSIGVIRGGAQTNIVPNYCEIEVDRRTLPGEDHGKIVAELCDRLHVEAQGVRDCPPLYTHPENMFVQRLADAVVGPLPSAGVSFSSRGGTRLPTHSQDALVGASWFCDAAVFSEHGVPAVAFGPGDIAQAHTADEFIELREVFRAAQILERFLISCA